MQKTALVLLLVVVAVVVAKDCEWVAERFEGKVYKVRRVEQDENGKPRLAIKEMVKGGGYRAVTGECIDSDDVDQHDCTDVNEADCDSGMTCCGSGEYGVN